MLGRELLLPVELIFAAAVTDKEVEEPMGYVDKLDINMREVQVIARDRLNIYITKTEEGLT